MSCPCECCKQERSERQRVRLQRRVEEMAARDQLRERYREIHAQELADQTLGARVRELAQRHLDGVWYSVDGPVKVCEMSMAHLCFALAKCERGELVQFGGRARVVLLRSELLRRLAGL